MLPPPAEKLQNFFGVFLQFQIGVDTFSFAILNDPHFEEIVYAQNGEKFNHKMQKNPPIVYCYRRTMSTTKCGYPFFQFFTLLVHGDCLLFRKIKDRLPAVSGKRSRVTVFGFSLAGKVQTRSGCTFPARVQG